MDELRVQAVTSLHKVTLHPPEPNLSLNSLLGSTPNLCYSLEYAGFSLWITFPSSIFELQESFFFFTVLR